MKSSRSISKVRSQKFGVGWDCALQDIIDNAPRLGHVFHESWHPLGEFTNEDCHSEYHPRYDLMVKYRKPKPYPVLFNGDNVIANALFNYPPYPYSAIRPIMLSLDDCVELAKLIISTSIQRLNYYFDQRMRRNEIPKTVGGSILSQQLIAKVDSI